jgi:hypothetical protein
LPCAIFINKYNVFWHAHPIILFLSPLTPHPHNSPSITVVILYISIYIDRW